MDGIQIYYLIIIILSTLLWVDKLGNQLSTKPSSFGAMCCAFLIWIGLMLPVAGRIFGWW